ncbi:MAG: ParB/RepB/Spo0J family partition protein [Flavobacteriales bacterium]|nr:ParB/RepB/Spo0J family partition protein [Flavobacteriales bacterium]HRO38615.1 ParB/RepB/Spo0J family partition protein [Flavobacteriales bacterium]
MTKKRGLGRGLSALLEDPGTDITEQHSVGNNAAPRVAGLVGTIPVSQIEPNPFQPRTVFSPEAILELAQSIKELGIIQPVTVRKLGYDRYQLISGERRFRASQVAGLTEIPAYIRIANDESMLEMALVENIQREELDAIEVAISFQRLLEEVNLTQESLSEKVGKDRATVANYLRLLKLPPSIQLGLRQRQIGMGHARALLAVADPVRQEDLFRRIIESQLSVRQVEEMARGEKHAAVRTGSGAGKMSAARHRELGKNLSNMFGSRVTVKQADTGKGKIEITFRNEEDLERIKRLLESR